MLQLRQLMEDVLANGKVEGNELDILRRELYADGKIDRREADFLVEMHKRLQRVTPAFEQFFYQAIKDHILADGKITAEEVAWLRQLLYADGRIDDREKKFLHQLRGEARQACPEFEALCKECLKA
jgi:hypothetical protein